MIRKGEVPLERSLAGLATTDSIARKLFALIAQAIETSSVCNRGSRGQRVT
jgi:hypothetical protein